MHQLQSMELMIESKAGGDPHLLSVIHKKQRTLCKRFVNKAKY